MMKKFASLEVLLTGSVLAVSNKVENLSRLKLSHTRLPKVSWTSAFPTWHLKAGFKLDFRNRKLSICPLLYNLLSSCCHWF